MEYLVQLMGIDHLLHFLVCFFLVIILTARFGKEKLYTAMLLIFGFVAFKEAYDIMVNTHHMTMSALVCDSLWDMVGNIFGLVAATICLVRLK